MHQHTIRVFLVDDYEVVRRGMRYLLESAGADIIGESATAHEAAARILEARPDVTVLDVRLPDGSGIDVCRRIRTVDPTIKVLMLTGYDDIEGLLDAISAGAAGYLSKSIVGTELLAAIHAVARGESVIDPAFLPLLSRAGQISAEDDELSSLTASERRILMLLGEGFTNQQIGDQVALAEGTVKTYVTKVLAKLGVERRSQAAVVASEAVRSGRLRTVAEPSRGVDVRD